VPAYQADVQAARRGENTFQITLPAREGRSAAEGAILHPLAAQLFLGRYYDFGRAGRKRSRFCLIGTAIR
jgi:hypothetical protein